MSNEKQNEFFSWRDRLNEPHALPEQGLENRDAAWNRLSARLRQEPGRRRIGYWMAAACLLLVFLFYPAPKPTPKPIPAQPQPAAIAQPPAEIAAPILKSQPMIVKRASHKKSPLPPIAITLPLQTADTPASAPPLLAQQPAAFPPPSPDTPHKQVIARQLRVVHGNDLDAAGRPEPAMTSIRDKDPQIKILVVLKNH